MPYNKSRPQQYLAIFVFIFALTASCWVFYAPACIISGQVEGSVYTEDGTFVINTCYVIKALRPLSEQLGSAYGEEISVHLNQVAVIPFQIGMLVWPVVQIALGSILIISNLHIIIYLIRQRPSVIALGIMYCLLLWGFMITIIGPQRGGIPYCIRESLIAQRCMPPVYYVNNIEVVSSTVILALLSTLGLVILLLLRLWAGSTAVLPATNRDTKHERKRTENDG